MHKVREIAITMALQNGCDECHKPFINLKFQTLIHKNTKVYKIICDNCSIIRNTTRATNRGVKHAN